MPIDLEAARRYSVISNVPMAIAWIGAKFATSMMIVGTERMNEAVTKKENVRMKLREHVEAASIDAMTYQMEATCAYVIEAMWSIRKTPKSA